jgi:hypothetical protein
LGQNSMTDENASKVLEITKKLRLDHYGQVLQGIGCLDVKYFDGETELLPTRYADKVGNIFNEVKLTVNAYQSCVVYERDDYDSSDLVATFESAANRLRGWINQLEEAVPDGLQSRSGGSLSDDTRATITSVIDESREFQKVLQETAKELRQLGVSGGNRRIS